MNTKGKGSKRRVNCKDSEEVDDCYEKSNTDKVHHLIRKYFGKFNKGNNVINSKGGKRLIEDNDIADRWKENIKKLYYDPMTLDP